jgi:2-oxo-4-hydroxy-4-carboxy--5-ureidoimidazoline (OHCU) decarboxylase
LLILNTIVSSEKFIHFNDDYLSEYSKPFVIKNTDKDLVEALHHRYRRDLSSDRNEGLKNITTRVTTKIFTSTLSNGYVRRCDMIMLG